MAAPKYSPVWCSENARLCAQEFDRLRDALKEIAAMKPSEISPGFKHGPALLLSNCQRVARRALRQN